MSIYDPGEAVTSGIGEALDGLNGTWQTRLAQDLPPAGHGTPAAAAVLAHVETTLGAPAGAGIIWINGERIPYATAIDGQFQSCTRDPFVRTTYRRGDLVSLEGGGHSALERARDDLYADKADGRFLSSVGRNYGVGRIQGASDTVYRGLIRTLGWMPAKGSRDSIHAFLRAILLDYQLTGSGNVASRDVVAAAGTFSPGMRRLPVEVTAGGVTRLCRIRKVSVDGSTLALEPRGSPHWRSNDLADGAVTFVVLPFEVIEPQHINNTVWVLIRTAPTEGPTGYGYLNGDETVTLPDDTTHVTVSHDIRQVLGVWLATDTRRQGTNYASDNNFAGKIITLDTPLPAGPPAVIVDYGAIFTPGVAPTTGIPGEAAGPATAELMTDVGIRNPEPILVGDVITGYNVRYPFYLGGRLEFIADWLSALTVAGVIPELREVGVWS